MKKIFSGMLFAWVLWPVLFASPAFSGKGPSAEVVERSHRFETVIEGDAVTHDFTIKNRGTAPLKIVKIESG